MRFTTLSLVSLTSVLLFSTFADTKSEYQRRYSMAECRLGSLAVKERDRDAQIGVWAINTLATIVVSSAAPTFAMSSGTSNCTDSPMNQQELEAMQREQNVYIAANLASLDKEAARGEGQTLDGLASLFGCESGNDAVAFKTMTRGHYEDIFEMRDAEQIRMKYLYTVQGLDESSRPKCVRLI